MATPPISTAALVRFFMSFLLTEIAPPGDPGCQARSPGGACRNSRVGPTVHWPVRFGSPAIPVAATGGHAAGLAQQPAACPGPACAATGATARCRNCLPGPLEAKDSLTDRLQAESVSMYRRTGRTIHHLADRYLTDYIEPIAQDGRRWKLVFFVLQGANKVAKGPSILQLHRKGTPKGRSGTQRARRKGRVS
jgi:hypothetical protein